VATAKTARAASAVQTALLMTKLLLPAPEVVATVPMRHKRT
jgi:hypothetical protein